VEIAPNPGPSMSERVDSLRADVLPIACAGLCLGLLALTRATGGWRAVQVAVVVLGPAIGFCLFWAVHRHRRSVAHEARAFGSSSSQHVDDLRTVPRFAGSVDQMRRLEETGGWIGGGLTVGATGIRWNPSAFSRRVRHVPAMEVDWSEVRAVRTEALSGIGHPAGVYVDLDDGSTWILNATPIHDLRRALDRYAPHVDEPSV
jgi:hypothetical protein